MGPDIQATTETAGADLHYEQRGEGPPVFIIQGGVAEAGATEHLAEQFSDQCSVISYDRRGVSRSTVTTREPVTMSRHADDAAAVLDALATEPARVVGASIGALIGLHLAVRHPERVATLIAHEPPMSTSVTDREREVAMDDIAALAREDAVAAIQRLAAVNGSDRETTEPGARSVPPVGDTKQNLQRFFEHDFPAVRHSALRPEDIVPVAATTLVIPTGGAASRGQWEYRCAERLAQHLGREIIELPGGHNGLLSHPTATATALRPLFAIPSSHDGTARA